ncbi:MULTISPECIES: TIGR03750 family conjugal transfer protein [Janthinobacterium]|jgi:conjugative transfer region protein (TIGR03750 family)|nr:TIGR03750 family conjugal transfer protein [Janthinobacterium lividum]MCL6483939.1 TIGR03750 family conjugal transfer protein [Janthinobacterium lividum]
MDDISDGGSKDPNSGHAPLTDRANREPVILRGLTSSEAQMAIFIVMPIYAVIGLVVAFVTSIWALGVLIASLAPMLTVWVVAGWLAKVKRNKPDYYYQHRFKLWLAKNGLQKSRFIDHDGFWETGRDVPVPRRSGQSKHLVKKAGG